MALVKHLRYTQASIYKQSITDFKRLKKKKKEKRTTQYGRKDYFQLTTTLISFVFMD